MTMRLSKTKAVREILRMTFPDYKGRKIFLEESGRVTLTDTNWGGGSRNSYVAVNLENGKVSPLPDFSPWGNPAEGALVKIPAGCSLVEHSIFCGQDAGVTIHIPPESRELLAVVDMKLIQGGTR